MRRNGGFLPFGTMSLDKPWHEYVGFESLRREPVDASDSECILWLDIDNTLYSHAETRCVVGVCANVPG